MSVKMGHTLLSVKMGQTLFCVLGLFSLNILLYCGHAQDAVLTIEPNWSTLFTGESVTFICDMRVGKDTDWYYVIYRNGREFLPFGTVKRYTSQSLSTDDSGEYQCIGDPKRSAHSRKQSNKVSLTVSDNDVILESPASTVFEGESVTLRCRHRNQTKEKNAVFYKDGSPTETDTNHQSAMSSENTVEVISDGSSYMCKFEDEESEPVKLKMEPQPKARLSRYFPSGGSVTLTCSVSPSSSSSSSSGWKYFWYRGNKASEPLTTKDVVFLSNETISVSQGGLYWCRGGRGDPLYYTEYSDPVVTNRAVVTLRPNRSEIYTEEKIILTCEIEDEGDAEWEYEWTTSSSYRPEKQKENMIRYALSSYNGEYRCVGTLKHEKSSTEWSDAFTLRVSDYPVFPDLTVSPLWLSPGASVTLNCSVKHRSPGWRFFWYKAVPSLSNDSYTYELIPGKIHGTEQDSYIVDGQTHTTGYVCGVQRGYPVYFSYVSRPKFVWSGDSHSAASLTVSPDRMQHFSREPVSLSCEGNSAEWRVSRFSVDGYPRHCSSSSSSSWGNMTGSRCNMDRDWQSGVYWCESETGQFSNAVNITIQYKPKPVLTVSPLWLSPGASVTLNCSVEHPSAGWRFFWYKAVPKLSDNSYSYELIPGSINGTEQDSYIVDGQTHTAGYVCRAGRGDPVYYTHYSGPKFVWSGDSHSAASLTVSPDRTQHFSREPVSLSCEGNSTEWRVSRFSEFGRMTHCSSSSSSSSWGTMTGSRCNMDRYWQSGVYWCVSETGQFSNVVNITKQDGDIILVSPVHPVTEGDSVTLGCKLRTEKVPYNVDFYKNDKLIPNVTGEELTISAVSKSDEGFYKCTGKKSQGWQSLRSPESWMSVKSASRHEQSPPFPVLLIVGPVCGVLLILLLLLFVYLYRKSKDSCFVRSQSSSRGPATDHMINQDETPPLHGDAVLYESIKGFEEPEHGESSDVTYSVVELKNITKKGKKTEEPEESAVYSDVKIRSATDNNVMYAQVNSHSKAKKGKGKSCPAAADETVYSEVKPGKTLDQ